MFSKCFGCRYKLFSGFYSCQDVLYLSQLLVVPGRLLKNLSDCYEFDLQTLFGNIVVFSPPRLTSFPTNKIKNLLFPFFSVFATCMHPFYIKNHVNVCKCSLIVESVRGSDKGECVPSPVS